MVLMKKVFLTFVVSICVLFFVGCVHDEYTRTKEFEVTMDPIIADNGVTVFSVVKEWSGCKTTSSYVGNVVKGSGTLWFLAEITCMQDNFVVIKIGYLGTPQPGGKTEHFRGTVRVTEMIL
jgi:hypothetical protein